MTLDEFWKLHEALPVNDAADVLTQRLKQLDAASVQAFNQHQVQCAIQAYSWDLWGAAYLIDGGCSDDGFMDFRYGLMARGRQVFEAALLDPDTLAQVTDDESDEGYIPNEDMAYVADRAYLALTGEALPQIETTYPEDPTGDEWDFDDEELCRTKFPALWAKHGASGDEHVDGHAAGKSLGAPALDPSHLGDLGEVPVGDNRTGRRVGG